MHRLTEQSCIRALARLRQSSQQKHVEMTTQPEGSDRQRQLLFTLLLLVARLVIAQGPDGHCPSLKRTSRSICTPCRMERLACAMLTCIDKVTIYSVGSYEHGLSWPSRCVLRRQACSARRERRRSLTQYSTLGHALPTARISNIGLVCTSLRSPQ
ncbi:hypothetical protein GY45DRAFT_864863 [Cubamyces sp. BRFM 1775]|nr:hypothetical protein GY45DRAFT_864863 [Cubamyces sp. BRFM 1775]